VLAIGAEEEELGVTEVRPVALVSLPPPIASGHFRGHQSESSGQEA